MNAIKELRRVGIVFKKRLSLFKYNLTMKKQLGLYNPVQELTMTQQQKRSLNLLDFNSQSDFYLLDPYSDSTQYGGETKTQLSLVSNQDNEKHRMFNTIYNLFKVRLETKLIKERSNLLMIDYMFGGFKTIYLLQNNFLDFNGLRITMKSPSHPCKLGMFLQSNFKEYEHFTGHIVDVQNPEQQEWQQYEIPISLMMNDKVRAKLVQAQVYDNFNTKGLTLTIESTHETKDPVVLEIKKIDVIFNPEYEVLTKSYKLPVFFKSLPFTQTFEQQGFIDNGRERFPYGVQKIIQGQKDFTVNNMAYQQATTQNKPQSKSIKERVSQ